MMKRIIYTLLLLVIITSCKKEESVKPYYFDEPIMDWTLSKSEVKELEVLELSRESTDNDSLYLIDIYGMVGDGQMSYYGVAPISFIRYGFFNINKTLVLSEVWFDSMDYFDGVLMFLENKYGVEFDYIENEYNKEYVWETDMKNIELWTFKKQNSFIILYSAPEYDF